MSLAGPAARSAFVALALLAAAAHAQVITEFDDNDPTIVYSPEASWFRAEEVNPMDSGGFHQVTTEVGATATFRFTGSRVEYHAPLWADEITTQITLDAGTPEVVSLQDPAAEVIPDGPTTQDSALRWSAEGLDPDVEHILVIGVPPLGGFGIVDLLVVESDEPATSSSSSSVSSTEPATTDSETASSTTTRRAVTATSEPSRETPATRAGLTIAIAVVCSLVGVIAICIAAFLFRRRHQRKRDRALWALQHQDQDRNLPPPPMDEIDDSINARKHRYRSIPSRNNLRASNFMDDDTVSQQSAAPSASGKQTSKLRQVVATEDGTRVGGMQQNALYEGSSVTTTPFSNQYPRTQ
ncbi:hypothetical protein FA15DRAFT_656627 [Coprinopsis marcescibilis]|uniref:Dystroglycan-type cadherin-like domain-containing protein n=1 Tax=Coprinopsis marcescibilis TaxID=230819 RepID=A0A5C3KSI9_COPMA|nr:hypothetical protein FA15DRAFT_656627 [Coprinopsis marcescibilis]